MVYGLMSTALMITLRVEGFFVQDLKMSDFSDTYISGNVKVTV